MPEDFNPRSLTGATIRSVNTALLSKPFQSTLPHGSDNVTITVSGGTGDFNPRSLTGATGSVTSIGSFVYISIHAPSRERRHGMCCLDCYERISIHAPSRERRFGTSGRLARAYFNPRSLTGATQQNNNVSRKAGVFQSTLPHGSDRTLQTCIRVSNTISIHAPSRERL